MTLLKKFSYLNRLGAFTVRFLFFISLVPLSAFAGAAPSEESKPDFSKVRKLIRDQMVEYSIASISVAAVRHGEVLWEEGFGWADRENRVPATEHTMYYVASLDKSFATMALMILRERKQLDLDRPVNDYLGNAKLTSPAWNPADATVRRLANHMAGLTTFNPEKSLPIDEMIHRYGVMFWPPGERFDYSNLGYKILDEVVARVSGASYANFLRFEVFWPLGMTHSAVGVVSGLENFMAPTYVYGSDPGSGRQPPIAAGIYCSAHDLARFGMFCLKHRLPDQKAILPDTSIDAMYDAPVSMDDHKYTLGWSIDNDVFGSRGLLAHGGTTAANAALLLIPSEDIAAIAVANSGMMYSPGFAREIVSALLPANHEKQSKTQQEKKTASPRDSAAFAAIAGNWKGILKTYREEIPLKFSISESGDLHAKLGSQLTTVMNDASFDGKRLRGLMSGDLGVEEDTGLDRYQLEFCLYLRDGALKGAAVTTPRPQLPFWAELKKENQEGRK